MHRLLTMLGLLLSIAGKVYAQDFGKKEITTTKYNALSPDDRLFTPAPYSIGIDYLIDLGRGNKFVMNLANGYDLTSFRNIDSLLAGFLDDLKPLRDSLSDPMTVKRIDYLIDTSGRNKLRIRQYRPAGTSFLVGGSEPALLKIPQDTIYIMLVKKVARHGEGKNIRGLRYDRLCFFLNRYSDLDANLAAGLRESIDTILRDMKPPHDVYSCPFCYLYSSSNLKSRPHFGNRLIIQSTADIQNYRNYFVPSFTLTAAVALVRGRHDYIFDAYWQPLFFFSPNAQGQMQTFRNDIVGIGFENYDAERPDGWRQSISFGWVAGSRGNYFSHPPSFSLSLGGWGHGPIFIGPTLYFDRFFKNVTPSLGLSVTIPTVRLF